MDDESLIMKPESPQDNLLPVKYFYKIEQLQSKLIVTECLDFLLLHSKILDVSMLHMMENHGITLGNGAFLLVRFEFLQPFVPLYTPDNVIPGGENQQLPNQETAGKFHQEIQESLGKLGRSYSFSQAGYLYILLCMQGETEEDRDHYISSFQELEKTAQDLTALGDSQGIFSRVCVSDVHLTAKSICDAYTDIVILSEYSHFLSEPPRYICQWNYRKKIETLSEYILAESSMIQKFTGAIRSQEQVRIRNCEEETVMLLLGDTPQRVEKIQTRFGQFMCRFLDDLLNNTIISGDFYQSMDVDSIVRTCENEALLRKAMGEFVEAVVDSSSRMAVLITKERLAHIKDYIDANLSDLNLSVTAVADYFHIGRSTLSTKFKSLCGISMAEYIRSSRVALAKSLMRCYPELTLEEVASRSGFSAVSTMYRIFMRVEHASPGTYKSSEH